MSWMFVHFPCFALDVRSRVLPENQAYALIEPGHSEVLLVNPIATEAGVRPGMSVSSACALCPDLKLIHRQPELEQHSLLDLAQLLYGYSAQISLKPPQGLLLEIGSMLRLFNGLENLWNQIRQAVQQQGFQVWQAVAHTPLAAQLLAHAGGSHPTLDKEATQNALQKLPINQCLLSDSVAERLVRMGIRQLGQLMELPHAELGRRFGRELPLFLAQLQGAAPDPQQFFTPPEHFVRRLEFFEEVETTSGLLFPLQRLLRELQSFLLLRQQVTPLLLIELGHRHQQDSRLEIRSVQAEYRAEEWLQLCRLRLERIQMYAGVLSLCLRVEELQPLQAESDDLFQEHHSQRLSRLQLLSRLQARLGAHCIQGLGVRADHRPEQAARQVDPGTSTSALLAGCNRPMWLMPEAEPVSPAALQLLRGPERIQSGWWDYEPPHQVCRDYYIARNRNGSQCWVYRTPEDHWFIQGWFG